LRDFCSGLEPTMTIPPEPTEIANAEALLHSCLERLAETLALALGLERDRLLRGAVGGAVPPGPCLLALESDGSFLGYASGELTDKGTLVGEGAPPAPVVDLRQALRESPALAKTARVRLRESGAQSEAKRLLGALQRDAHNYSADDFFELSRWAPLLARQAYLHTAATQMLIDRTRNFVRERPSEKGLRERWNLMHALSHSTLLATSAGPTTWLAEMADTFAWEMWTPSFPLVRERVTRLAMRGAWAAARFGTPVVDRYLRVVVEGRQPLHRFDAVLGATAIALASPRDGSVILRRLERALRSRIAKANDAHDRFLTEACLRSVHVAINEPSAAEDRTLLRGRRLAGLAASDSTAMPRETALFLALDDEADCATIDEHGVFPAILALPSAVGASPQLFFGTAATRQCGPDPTWTAARARAVLDRSNGLTPCSCGGGRPAHGSCRCRPT
jgi:hypothetical protein